MYPLSVYSSVTFRFAHKAVSHQAQSIPIANNRSAILLAILFPPHTCLTQALANFLLLWLCLAFFYTAH